MGDQARRAVLYLRVSSADQQDPAAQEHACRQFCAQRGWSVIGCEADRISGDPARRRGDPPGLAAALLAIGEHHGAVLVVFAADRLVRGTVELLQMVARIQALGGFVAGVTERGDLDTTTEQGELLLFMRGWWARMELRLNRARTLAGLERARLAGRVGGRRRVELPDLDQVEALRRRKLGLVKIAAELGCSEWTAREAVRALKRRQAS